MTVLKSNLCPTCGGLLNIDIDKQMYVCPFCGVSFDYEYFREDNVKDVASKAIGRNEFGSAKDAYDFMLAKDPHDFEALRGLFLCANKWKTMYPMLNESDVHVSADDPALLNAAANCLPEHKAYFEKVREALKELDHYRDLRIESHDIAHERDTEEKVLYDIRQEYYYNSRRFTSTMEEIWELDEKTRDAIISCIGGFSLLIIVVLVQSRAWPVFGIIAALIVLGIIIYHIVKSVTAKQLLARMTPVKKKIEELGDKYKAKSDEAAASHRKYNDLVHEFLKMDPVPQKAPAGFPAVGKKK